MSGARAPLRAAVAALAGASLLAAGCAAGARTDAGEEALLVAAASDLLPAFTELGDRFTDETGQRVTFAFGSSGQLAQQIAEGAPMDVFASADGAYVDTVLEAGRGDASTRATYATGRLVIWSRADAWGGWSGLDELLADGDAARVAIANPEHAPYGRAAREALSAAGLPGGASDRLVYGENVSDAQRLAASGNADAAIVARSLAVAADERGEGAWVLVPAGAHAPLEQQLVVVTGDPERARSAARFADLVTGDTGRAVLEGFGFELPDAPAREDR